MLKKVNRVKKHEEFQKVIQARQVEKNQTYVVYYQRSESQVFRVGISVSKKLGNAITRNKIKRQVRHIIHDLKDIIRPLDYVVIVKEKYKNYSFLENQTAMLNLLKKIWRKIDEQNKKVA